MIFFLLYISVLVINGFAWTSAKSEVFDPNSGKTCGDFPPFPDGQGLQAAIGETVNGFPLICGGIRNGENGKRVRPKGCYTLKSNSWSKVGDMRQPRSFASSLLLANLTLWIIGGVNQDGLLRSSEVMDLSSPGAIIPIPGPDLPKKSAGHCSVLHTKMEAIIMGGHFGRKTYFYNIRSPQAWIEGPQLKDSGDRFDPACGQIADRATYSQ